MLNGPDSRGWPGDLFHGTNQGEKRAATRLAKVVDFQADTNAATQARLLLDMARGKLGQTAGSPALRDEPFSLSGGDWNDKMTTQVLAHEAQKVAAP